MFSFKVFSESLMVDMAFKMYYVLHSSSNENRFALSTNTVLATTFPPDFNSTLLSFSENSSKLCCIDITSRRAAHSKDLSNMHCKDRYIYLLRAIIEGTLVIVYQINAPFWYETTCSESESRNFDCQWPLVSFLVKHNQFYREARLTCPLYRSKEDICINIYVLKSVLMQQHF